MRVFPAALVSFSLIALLLLGGHWANSNLLASSHDPAEFLPHPARNSSPSSFSRTSSSTPAVSLKTLIPKSISDHFPNPFSSPPSSPSSPPPPVLLVQGESELLPDDSKCCSPDKCDDGQPCCVDCPAGMQAKCWSECNCHCFQR